MKEATSAAEHTTIQHIMATFEHLQKKYMKLKELNEYEAHAANEDLEAEYLNIIEFEDKVVGTTSTVKYVIDRLRKKEREGLTETSDSQSHELSKMTKLASREHQQAFHPVPDQQDTKEKRSETVKRLSDYVKNQQFGIRKYETKSNATAGNKDFSAA